MTSVSLFLWVLPFDTGMQKGQRQSSVLDKKLCDLVEALISIWWKSPILLSRGLGNLVKTQIIYLFVDNLFYYQINFWFMLV